jgi:hypothetical protein
MSKIESAINNQRDNPFLTDRADALWTKLSKGGRRISKEELLKRAKALSEKKQNCLKAATSPDT